MKSYRLDELWRISEYDPDSNPEAIERDVDRSLLFPPSVRPDELPLRAERAGLSYVGEPRLSWADWFFWAAILGFALGFAGVLMGVFR